MYQIEHYLSANEQKDLYIAWLRNLRDSKARVAVIRRVMRMEPIRSPGKLMKLLAP